jgi:hypothetical protein
MLNNKFATRMASHTQGVEEVDGMIMDNFERGLHT